MFYGAAEFSRDTDLAILADDLNLSRLWAALGTLRIRLNFMSKMCEIDPFADLWEKRTTPQSKEENRTRKIESNEWLTPIQVLSSDN